MCYVLFFVSIEYYISIITKENTNVKDFLSAFGHGGLGSVLGILLIRFLMNQYFGDNANANSVDPNNLSQWLPFWQIWLVLTSIVFVLFLIFFRSLKSIGSKYQGQSMMN